LVAAVVLAGAVDCGAGVVAAGVVVEVTVGCVVVASVCVVVVVAGVCVVDPAACWFAFAAARLRLREPPAYACVASSDIAAITISVRMESPVIWSIPLT